jgi:hypothetical protein
MIVYTKNTLRIGELWFDEELNGERLDIVRHFQRTTPTAEGKWTRFCTMLLDLSRDPSLLLGQMERDTRYEIRRAETKDKLTHRVWTDASASCLSRFRSFYDTWAAQHMSKVSHLRLLTFAKIGALALSEVTDESGTSLVWHVYCQVEDRVRLLHSVSSLRGTSEGARRSMLGRANRFHHWRDVLTFQAQGVRHYDFGGWYDGQSDSKGLSLNQFKEGFGGRIVLNYNGLCGLTFAGRAAVWFYARMRPSDSA